MGTAAGRDLGRLRNSLAKLEVVWADPIRVSRYRPRNEGGTALDQVEEARVLDVFALRDHLVGDYRHYAESFFTIRDESIDEFVKDQLDSGLLWPDPMLQLNPAFEPGGFVDDLVDEGLLDAAC